MLSQDLQCQSCSSAEYLSPRKANASSQLQGFRLAQATRGSEGLQAFDKLLDTLILRVHHKDAATARLR